MRRLALTLTMPSLAGALALSVWLWWPRETPRSRSTPVSASARPRQDSVESMPNPATTTPISAAVSPPRPALEPTDDEATWRQLASLSTTDKPRALQLALAADASSSPDGVRAEARRALIVSLLVDVGRMPEARARTQQFMAEYPSSRYLPLVQGVTGIHPRPSPSQLRDAQARTP